ncbi:MAG: HNH endonuclease [Candidatus Pacearchaeota archaeon]|nr:HNH endonuclease [Candidatus Pacearchaeota archaeon]
MAWLFKDKKGYPRYANSGVPVHRAVAQNKIGRKLREGEVVHHNDEDKSNFRRGNISVMSRSFHSKLHVAKKRGFW